METQKIYIKKVGHGHFQISYEVNGEMLSTVTTNTLAIDNYLDDSLEHIVRVEAWQDLTTEILSNAKFETT